MAFVMPVLNQLTRRSYIEVAQSQIIQKNEAPTAIVNITNLTSGTFRLYGRRTTLTGTSPNFVHTYAYNLLFKMPCTELIYNTDTRKIFAAVPDYINIKGDVIYFATEGLDDDEVLALLPASNQL